MRRALPVLGAAILALGLAACGSSSSSSTGGSTTRATANPTSASLMITHIVNGCHSWAGPGMHMGMHGAPSATLRVAPGATVRITNNDVMPHMLKTVSAAGALLATPAMDRPGATSTVALPKHPGVYTFTTKAGEDYAKGIKTTGPDNTLTLKVIVA
jgi:plastocyanin